MRFPPLPGSVFRDFHAAFRGDDPLLFEVCKRCGGACEYNKIGTLMPGEKEYMARESDLSVDEFSDRYLDVIVMDDGVELDVLRMVDGCPFLDKETYECRCREFKVVLCEIYPIGFRVSDAGVRFLVDRWCPLTDTPEIRRLFEEVGIPAVASLPVPVQWYRYVAEYDELYFDYSAVERDRGGGSGPKKFLLSDLLRYRRSGLERGPKERYRPSPSELLDWSAGKVTVRSTRLAVVK